MQRRLEDVSHFFFDHRGSIPTDQSLSRDPRRAERGPRIIHLTSLGDVFTSTVIVAGLAASAAHSGRRVLAAETHELPFGIAFGFGLPAPGQGSPIVESAPGLWVSCVPLLGAVRPGVLFDPPASAQWRARATQADVVLVHLTSRGSLRVPGMPSPDEFWVVAGDGAPDGPAHAYRAIKRAASVSPSIELGFIAVGGDQDERSARARDKLVLAVETFMGRQCPMVDSIPSVSALSRAFMAGAVWREGNAELTRAAGKIAGRWPRSTGSRSASTLPAEGGRPEGRLLGWGG